MCSYSGLGQAHIPLSKFINILCYSSKARTHFQKDLKRLLYMFVNVISEEHKAIGPVEVLLEK